jgi:hypothetical protein
MRTAILAVLLLAVPLVPLATADVVHLKNGGRIEGDVEDLGDAYRVKLRSGAVTIKKADVAGIEAKPTLADLYREKLAEIDPEDPEDRVALGLWCREQDWEAKAREEFAKALELDEHHRGAHVALGEIYYEGEWRTEAEIMELRGFVLHEGEWMTPEEAEIRKSRKEMVKRARNLQRTLTRAFRRLAGSSDRAREKAYDEIVTLAREVGSGELEEFAAKAKSYYEQAWGIVRSQTGIMEIRAQWTRLKRPIPTLTTTLGALSTPVTIQLPELSVASIGTTVVVPLGGR